MLMLCLFSVSAEETQTTKAAKQTWSHLTVSKDGKTAKGYCPHCCADTSKTVTWKLFTRGDAHNYLTTSGHYFLGESSVDDGAFRPNAKGLDFVLHLNGQTYKRFSEEDNTTGVIFPSVANTTFSIVDDKEQRGTLHGDYGWVVNTAGQTGTKVVLYSGNLTSNVTEILTSGPNTNGGTVYMNGGTFEMYGGTINGTKAVYGGAICISGGAAVNIYGGTIQGGQATNRGGNIYMSAINCKLNIYGGTIKNGVCLNDSANVAGGGNIYVNNGDFTLSGGLVTGGKAVRGGNIYTNTGASSEGNSAVIDGEATLQNGEATYGGNLYINRKFTLGAGAFKTGKATYGSDIYVAKLADMTVADTYNGAAKIYYDYNHVPGNAPGNMIAPFKNKASDSAVAINRCTGVFTGKLYLENCEGLPYIYAKKNDNRLHITGAALVDKQGKVTWYKTNADAVKVYSSNTAYMRSAAGALALTGSNYVVDLAGGNVTISGTGKVTLFDSANDDYKTYGTATISGVKLQNGFKTTVAGRDTFMVKSGSAYSFHRAGVKIVGVSVRPGVAGMYYTGLWQCDDLLATKVDSFGVAVSVQYQPGENFAKDADTLFTSFDKTSFASGTTKTGALIHNILKEETLDNDLRAETKVYASAYITFDGGAVAISSENVDHSLQSALKLAEANLYDYAAEADALQTFCDTWENAGVSWDLNFSLAEDEKQLLSAYSGRKAYHGEAHDHAATGGNSDGNCTLEQWAVSMADRNMDFATIADHRQTGHMTLPQWDTTKFIGGSEASTLVQGTGYVKDKNKMHYNMLFTDPKGLENVIKSVRAYNYRYDSSKGTYVFDYPNLTVSQIQSVIQAVKNNGGMFTHVHPKSEGYIQSNDPLKYYFADWTGLEVFYGFNGYAPEQAVNSDSYRLWTDLLARGKKIWATAGADQHGAASTDALTTIYSEAADAKTHFSHMKVGDSTCGPVGIRMVVGDTLMGSETDFAGKRVVFCVSDFHEVAYDPTHTYRVELLSNRGVVYSGEIDPAEPFFYGMDADDRVKFYRVEVFDVTAGCRIAIGNPIWNQ